MMTMECLAPDPTQRTWSHTWRWPCGFRSRRHCRSAQEGRRPGTCMSNPLSRHGRLCRYPLSSHQGNRHRCPRTCFLFPGRGTPPDADRCSNPVHPSTCHSCSKQPVTPQIPHLARPRGNFRAHSTKGFDTNCNPDCTNQPLQGNTRTTGCRGSDPKQRMWYRRGRCADCLCKDPGGTRGSDCRRQEEGEHHGTSMGKLGRRQCSSPCHGGRMGSQAHQHDCSNRERHKLHNCRKAPGP
mmetsp:Transcript_144806/g.361120  ORF Transcript_144806/g.361120 Transcript_144806/m.361120 type:complete len:239 (+) Transcript_144806:747-1463(+)